MYDRSNNLVTFLPIGGSDHVVLQLGNDWTITGGLDCSTNTADIKYTERAKLPTNLVYVSGTICFWGSVDPAADDAEPEHALANQWLINCVANRRGKEHGDVADKVASYTLTFADHRHAFTSPRGGRLTQGLGNPDPLGDATLINNHDLIAACLTAMGISASIPSSVNAVDAKRQLEWFCSHAPTELGELLQHTGHVYCPYSGGGGTIQRLGLGTLPTFPAGRVSTDVTASGVSRLPRTVVVTSGPNAEARTYTKDVSGDGAPQWEFVVMDPDNQYKWAEISTVAALGSDAAQALTRSFPDASEPDRKQLSDQLYKVIRLKSDRYNRLQCPVLREVLMPDGTIDQPHLVATVAIPLPGGGCRNQQTRLNANVVDGANNMLSFDTRLGTVTGGDERADIDAFFQPLGVSDIKPTFTVEDYNDDDGRVYSVYGFVLGVLTVGSISEAAARDKFKGYYPDTAIVDAPELRTIWLNDGTNNRDANNSAAQGIAQGMLVDSTDVRTIVATGFLPCQIDGRINEVRYNQERYSTTIVRDGWGKINGGHRDHRRGGGSSHAGGPSDNPARQAARSPHSAKRHAQATQHRRGGSMVRTAAAITPPPAPTGYRIGFAKVGDSYTGQLGRAKAKSVSGKLNRTLTADYAASDLGADGVADDLIVSGAGHQKIPLATGEMAVVLIGATKDDTSTPHAVAIPLPQTYRVKVYKDGGAAGTNTTRATWTYTVKTLDGRTFATAVPVYKTRPIGKRDAAADGRFAFVFWDESTLKIWDIDEVDDATGCGG